MVHKGEGWGTFGLQNIVSMILDISGRGDDLTYGLAVKGVTYNNLIRLGVLWGKGQGAYKRGVFEQSWGCHPPQRIRVLHKTICEKLRQKLFEPFDVLSILIGDKNARKFCMDSLKKYLCRPQEPIMVDV